MKKQNSKIKRYEKELSKINYDLMEHKNQLGAYEEILKRAIENIYSLVKRQESPRIDIRLDKLGYFDILCDRPCAIVGRINLREREYSICSSLEKHLLDTIKVMNILGLKRKK